MDIKQAIAANMSQADFLVDAYLADLTPTDMLARSVPSANHIAWQLGHLIAAERNLIEKAVPGKMDALPQGFEERHKKGTAASDNANDFLTKEEYQQIAKQVRANTLRVVEGLAPEDFDRPATGGPPFITSVGGTFMFISSHWLMHAGQWAITRRGLGRPPLF